MPPLIAFAGALGGLAVVRWAYKTAVRINRELEEARLARVAEAAQTADIPTLRRHLPTRDDAACAWPEALERGLCAALAAAQGRALRRKSQPDAALLSVSGDHEAVAAEPSGPVPEVTGRDRHRLASTRHPLRRG